jgi:SlyX protein
MDEVADLRMRLETLEAHVAHQDRTIEELNETITAQWKDIDALRRQLARLDDELREVEAGLPAPPNQKPPHY